MNAYRIKPARPRRQLARRDWRRASPVVIEQLLLDQRERDELARHETKTFRMRVLIGLWILLLVGGGSLGFSNALLEIFR